ncbi:MAG: YceI family protein [Deltaproteobacteria bacterium]|nr:YceI family protein [Deltaproteobacteria bacterium]
MRTSGRRFSSLIMAAVWLWMLVGITPAWAEPQTVFTPAEHCVAYRVTKGTLYVSKAEVIGRNCKVKTALKQTRDGKHWQVVVTIPVAEFDSGTGRRDSKVREWMDAQNHPDILFTSRPLTSAEISGALRAGKMNLEGELTVRGKAKPITFALSIQSKDGSTLISASAPARFSVLEIPVENIGPGGFIANLPDDLELLGQFQWQQVEGAAGMEPR